MQVVAGVADLVRSVCKPKPSGSKAPKSCAMEDSILQDSMRCRLASDERISCKQWVLRVGNGDGEERELGSEGRENAERPCLKQGKAWQLPPGFPHQMNTFAAFPLHDKLSSSYEIYMRSSPYLSILIDTLHGEISP